MLIPESWLRAWVDIQEPIEALAHRLTMAGLEVEDIRAKAPPFSGVVVGRIVSAERHPDADRLQVCQVDVGGAAPLQIVCGAPNARAGLAVACATDGAMLPGSFNIKKTKMRGVASEGMLCSSRELGISEESEGILELEALLGNRLAPEALGGLVRDLLSLDEKILEIKLTPNRADCLSVAGVAREVSALTGLPLKYPAWAPATTPAESTAAFAVNPSVPTPRIDLANEALDHAGSSAGDGSTGPRLCALFASRVIQGIDNTRPTPDFILERLLLAGQRSVNLVVDISNYLMLELGQPSHAFDLAALGGPDLVVRFAQDGETLQPLVGETPLRLGTADGLVVGPQGPAALAGVMGGLHSGVSPQSTAIVLECAHWMPDAIRGRAAAHKLSSEAAHRFERGVDPSLPLRTLHALTQLILEYSGGQAGPLAVAERPLAARPAVTLRLSRLQQLMGIQYEPDVVRKALASLGFEPKVLDAGNDTTLTVAVPSHRFDIAIEEDLVEEVARVLGYDALPSLPPKATVYPLVRPEAQRGRRALRSHWLHRGYTEAVTYSFISEAMAASCGRSAGEPIRLLNPISEPLSVMRPSLVPGLLKVVQDNAAHRESRVRVFEIGRVFHRSATKEAGPWQVAGVDQPVRIAACAWGARQPEGWASSREPVDFFDMKADVEAWFGEAAAELVFKPSPGRPDLHPGRSAEVWFRGHCLGVVGAVHPAVVQALGLPSAPVACELALEGLLASQVPVAAAVVRTPFMLRDLALVLPISTPAGDVVAKLRASAAQMKNGQCLQDIRVFDDYRGVGLPEGEKSLGLRITLQAADRTLADDEADAIVAGLVQAAQKSFNARLR